MSFKLKREIYGNNLWMVDENSFSGMLSLLSDFRNGKSFDPDENGKCNNYSLFDTKSATIVRDDYDLRNAPQDDVLVGVINLDGVITKNGGLSSYGTKHLSNQIKKFNNDSRVKGTLVDAASGGGSGQAIQYMRDTIKESEKPVGAWIEKGEIAASACYGIISACDFIMVENENVEVGSLGTFIQFGGFPKENTDTDGFKNVRIYAPESTHKNFIFEQAINDNNFKPVIEELLVPANNEFLGNIQSDRPSIDRSIHMTGKMFKAKEVMGSMVDSVGSFDDAINLVLSMSEQSPSATINTSTNNTNINNKQMNKSELKTNHSALFDEVRNEGVNAERERQGSWMAWFSVDNDAVMKGIESGKEISPSQREAFIAKQSKATRLGEMKSEAAGDLTPADSKSAQEIVDAQQKEEEEFYKDI